MTLLDTLSAQPAPLAVDEQGVVRVAGTRVTLDTVIGAFNDGHAPEEIAWSYPSVRLIDVYAIIAYYLWHRAEVDAYLEQRRREADELQRRHEQLFPPKELRERLPARSVQISPTVLADRTRHRGSADRNRLW